jgi:hypothetical protein
MESQSEIIVIQAELINSLCKKVDSLKEAVFKAKKENIGLLVKINDLRRELNERRYQKLG